MRNILLGIVLLSSSYGLNGQGIIDLFKKYRGQQDTTYVQVYPQTYSLKTYFSYRNFTLKLTDLEGQGSTIAYRPNNPLRLGFGASYKDIRFGFSVKLPSFFPDRGNTHSWGMFINTQTNIFSWGFDFYLIRNRGYYLDNPEAHIPLWDKSMDYPFRSDIRTLNIGMATHIVFSKKFSLKAAVIQSEKQLKSAGGIALDLALKFSGLRSDSTIIPYSQRDYYTDLVGFGKGGFFTIAISPGYAYTYVYKDFYATALAYLGVGIQTQTYVNDDDRKWSMQLRPKFKFMQIIGYTSNDYFANISFIYENNLVRFNHTRLNSSYLNVSIGVGFRF
jgi:hypothetical protein